MRVCPTCFALYGPDHLHCPKDGAATEDPVSVLIGKSLGSYQVRALIGEGGMGVVYAGEHTTIGRRIALKVLRPELSLRDDIVERFVQEARAVNTISHGNIVNIYDFGKTPFGSFYIVMEYLDGKNVRTLLDEEGAQPLERVRDVVVGVAAALAAAHNKGFIHRDVKPENIMLVDRAGGQGIKLLDFGIAKLLTADGTGPTTHTGGALGTPQYMCPEQLEDVSYDHRSDIYSLGVVAYEMLTGHLPYPGKSHAEVRQLQLTRTPPPPSVVRPEAPVSRRLDAAVLWALSPDPATRCTQMEDFLSHFEAGCDDAANVPAHPQYRVRRPGIMVVVLVALTAMLLGGAVVYFVLPDRPTPVANTNNDGAVDTRKQAPLTAAQAKKLSLERVKSALQSDSGDERTLITEILAMMERPPVSLREEVVARLQDEQPEPRRNAARILTHLRDPSLAEDKAVQDQLRLLLAKERNTTKKWIFAQALAKLEQRDGLQHLHKDLRRLEKDSKGVFLLPKLLRTLGQLGDQSPAVEKSIKKHAMTARSELKYELLGYLAAMDNKAAQNKLEEGLRTQGETRVKAAIALLKVNRDLAVKTLQEAQGSKDLDEDTRLKAAYHLALFQDASSAKVLVEFAQSSRPTCRKESAIALGHLENLPDDARKALIKILGDKSPEVRLAAAVALLR